MNKEARKVPRIRFKGFTDDWEQRKASDIFTSISNKNHVELPVLSASQEKGMVFRSQNGIDIKYDKDNISNYKKVKPGQFVIHLRSFQSGFAYSEVEGITSPAYTIIDFKNPTKDYPQFWKEVFAGKIFIKRLESITYGIRDGRSISFSDFTSLKFLTPKYEEQKRVGKLLIRLDQTIALHQRKVDLLKEQKKVFLREMFPSNNSDLPNIRFKGFVDEWEQRKFGDILISNPYREWLATPQSHGNYKVIQQGNIPILGYADGTPFKNFEDVTLFGDHTVSLYKPQAPFFTATDGVKILSAKNIYGNYLYILLERYKPDSEGYKRHFSILKDQEIFFTKNLYEQIAIGGFFLQIENAITLHQGKLIMLKKIKQIYLQNMFI